MSAFTVWAAGLATQPVLWWKNDSSTSTQANSGSSGATDQGTVGANVTKSVAPLLGGDPSNCMTFPGSANNVAADTVRCAADATNLQPTTGITILAVVRPTSISGTNGNLIAWYGDNTNTAAYALILDTGGKLHSFIDVTGSVHKNCQSTLTLSTNTIYFVVFTWDGTTMRQYINGVADATTTANSANIIYTDLTSGIFFGEGGYPNSAAGEFYDAFAGQIWHLMLFKNLALTAAQISTGYAALIAGSGSPYPRENAYPGGMA